MLNSNTLLQLFGYVDANEFAYAFRRQRRAYTHTEIDMFQRQMAYNMVVNTARRATDKPIPGKAYWDFSKQGLRLRGHLHVPHALTQ
jgi:hypothetical protein